MMRPAIRESLKPVNDEIDSLVDGTARLEMGIGITTHIMVVIDHGVDETIFNRVHHMINWEVGEDV